MPQTDLSSLLPDIAQVCRKAPDATMIRALNRAAREFCKQTRWLRSSLQGTTAPGQSLYSMGSDPDLEVIGIRAMSAARQSGNTSPWTVRVSSPELWQPGISQGAPLRFAYVPEGQFALNPVPDQVYDLLVTIVMQPTLGCTSVPSEILVRWDRALKAGALAYLLEIPGQPWTDPAQAQLKQRDFQASINNARADEQREYQTGPVTARRRQFIVGSM